MKKKILFMLKDFRIGGTEKSLISLLNILNYDKYEVDILVVNKEGVLISDLPNEVNIIEIDKNEKIYFENISILKKSRYINKHIVSRIIGSIYYKLTKGKPVWNIYKNNIKSLENKYDIAIAYMDGIYYNYIAHKVDADYKLAWVHFNYNDIKSQINNLKKEIDIFNKIITVSEECSNSLKSIFPNDIEKIKVFHNVINMDNINKLAEEKDDHIEVFDGIKLCTVGRLIKDKGFDLVVETIKILKNEGYNLRWYIVGKGELESYLIDSIASYNLEEEIILVGETSNPYLYMKSSDIYVHPSRTEGKSVAVEEAKALGCSIILTNYETAKTQIRHGINGLIVDINAESIAKGIKSLIENDKLRIKLGKNAIKEKAEILDQIAKFDEIVEFKYECKS